MRRGTHSCLECRQRKIRCVNQPHAGKCNGCSARDLRCTDQELRRSRSPESGERKSTRDRVQELEGMLDQVLYNQSEISRELNSHKAKRNFLKPLEGLAAVKRSLPATGVEYVSPEKYTKVSVLESNLSDIQATMSRGFSDEPLLELFENVDVGDRPDRNPRGNRRDPQIDLPVANQSTHRSLQILQLQIPNARDLSSILRAGQSNLSIWSGAFPDELGPAGNGLLERLPDHIYGCLHSDRMADAAKVILCLALHIQQLPADVETANISFRTPLHDVQDTCMSTAESLLASDEGPAGTLDGLECMLLQSDFYVNTGNLRKVWLIVRRAVSLAQLLGLYRKTDARMRPKLALRENTIWSELWQRDRGFSLILGLPYAALESQKPQLISDDNGSDLQSPKWLLRDLGVVMGHIIDRDQDLEGTTYSTTLKIEEELEECHGNMSAEWWAFTPSLDTATDTLCGMFMAKMRFYTVQRLLHLPYLLRAFGDRKYQSSRLATLQSSREMINVYNVLRDEKRPVLKVCDMADFQVFAAAMTLTVDLLACPHPPDHHDLHREERDWQLVLQTAVKLRRFSQSRKGCRVATLGARVLEDFSNLRTRSTEEVCKVDIPYFGKLEIHPRDTRHNEQDPHAHSVAQTIDQTQTRQDFVGGLEGSMMSAVSTDSYLFPTSAASHPWQAADESWMHMLDPGLADDWSWLPCGDGT